MNKVVEIDIDYVVYNKEELMRTLGAGNKPIIMYFKKQLDKDGILYNTSLDLDTGTITIIIENYDSEVISSLIDKYTIDAIVNKADVDIYQFWSDVSFFNKEELLNLNTKIDSKEI